MYNIKLDDYVRDGERRKDSGVRCSFDLWGYVHLCLEWIYLVGYLILDLLPCFNLVYYSFKIELVFSKIG